MIYEIIDMFSYGFMQRALIAGILISICAAILGVPLVLRRYAMIGDGLSHVGFASLAVSAATNSAPMLISMPIVIFSAFIVLNLSQKKIHSDAAIALISTTALALGVMILSLSDGMNTDVNNFLFGSILGISAVDLSISVVFCLIIISLYILLYQRIFALTFDENFAKVSGINVKALNLALALMMAVIIVLGMRIMGALLISNLIVIPALTAMRVFSSFFKAVIYAAFISVICFILGLITSYILDTPTGASIVLFNVLALALHVLFKYKFL